MNKYSLSILAFALSASSLYSPLAQTQDNYNIIDLGSFEGGNSSFGYSINSTNQVVGYSTKDLTTGFARGFIYDSGNSNLTDLGAIDNSEVLVEITNTVDGVETTEFVDLGIGTDSSSLIFDVNNDGFAVGFSVRIFGSVTETENTDGTITETAVATTFERAIYVDSNTLQLSEVPDFTVNSPQKMRAIAIKNDYIVGTGSFNEPDDLNEDGSDSSVLFDRGFIYETSSNNLTRISPPNDELTHHLTLRDINASGFAVGISAERSVFGTLFNNKIIGVNLNEPNDVFEYAIFGTDSRVSAINAARKIVGRAVDTSNSYLTAYMYDIDSDETTDLGVLNSNFPYAEAFDINDSDQIVGLSQTKSQPSTFSGFIYENGEMKDLSKMIGCNNGWTIHEARSINNSGFITGTGLLNGEARAFMLQPIEGNAPVCEDESAIDGSGSTGLISLFSLLGFVGIRRRYLKN